MPGEPYHSKEKHKQGAIFAFCVISISLYPSIKSRTISTKSPTPKSIVFHSSPKHNKAAIFEFLDIRNLSKHFTMASLDASTLFNVKDLVAVITGGGSGIGVMLAKALALNGARKVYIIGRREQPLQNTEKESPHGNIVGLTGDVTSKSDLERIVEHIKKDVGYINVLIANSGVSGPQLKPVVTKETSLEDFQKILWDLDFQEYTNTFAVNCSAVFFSIAAFLGLLDAGNKKGMLQGYLFFEIEQFSDDMLW